MAEEGKGPRETTLVKFDHPRLITTRSLIQPNPLFQPSKSKYLKKGDGDSGIFSKSKTIGDVCSEVLSQIHPDDMLGLILPAKEWQEDGKQWRQIVSSVPATKADVIDLFQALDTRMKEGRAKETGICPTRRELYSQCLDELIRQVAIICDRRGILLLRIRNEIQMTMTSYESLYISATAYALRRTLMNRIQRTEMEARTEALIQEQSELQKKKRALKKELEKITKEHAIIEQKETEARAAELENLKKINAELKRQKDLAMGVKKRQAAAKEAD